MAIDGQPAEPFIARDSRVALARATASISLSTRRSRRAAVAPIVLETDKGEVPLARLVYEAGAPARPAPLPDPKPLPANPLPERMDFRGVAVRRRHVPLGAKPPAASRTGKPLFSVKRGRTVMLGLVNRTALAHSVHLHGHHFRLLDRLDDGWKPFWLDTLMVPKMDTWRIAFVADNPGKWVIQARRWSNPGTGQVAWFEVT